MYDVLIIGGGPTGLSVALVLGRNRWRVLVVGSGRPCRETAQASRGYLSRAGVRPSDFLRLGREEVSTYGVEFLDAEADGARRLDPSDAGGHGASSRSVRKRAADSSGGSSSLRPESEISFPWGRPG